MGRFERKLPPALTAALPPATCYTVAKAEGERRVTERGKQLCTWTLAGLAVLCAVLGFLIDTRFVYLAAVVCGGWLLLQLVPVRTAAPEQLSEEEGPSLDDAFDALESGTFDLEEPSQRVTSRKFLKSSAEMLAEGWLGPYRIIEELGRGTSGIVYKAEWAPSNRLVAMKILRRAVAENDRLRFIREVKAVSKLEHPHIVPIYEVDTLQGRPYYSMMFIPGDDFEKRLAKGGGTVLKVRVLAAICEALEYLHACGYVHRDVKPANILLGEDETPFLVDFGYAKNTANDMEITQPGSTVGTPLYMAPEQILGRSDQLGPHTDVYSLGTILYQVLAGTPPYRRDDMAEIIDATLHEDPFPPSTIFPGVPAVLEEVCMQALAKPIADRCPSAAKFREALCAWLDSQGLPHAHA